MSLTDDLNTLRAQWQNAKDAVVSLENQITAKQQAIDTATLHSGLWDEIEGKIAGVEEGVKADIMATVAKARSLLNL
jgi:hypothetical protein